MYKRIVGVGDLETVISEYLKLCVEYDNSAHNSKYCVQMMLREQQESERGRKFLDCQTLEEIWYANANCAQYTQQYNCIYISLYVSSDIWDLGSYCRSKQIEYQERGMQNRRTCVPGTLTTAAINNGPESKKQRFNEDVIETNIAFFRAHYTDTELPKSKLHVHAAKNDIKLPIYQTQQEDRLFRSILAYDNKKYASSYWEKNKRFAEQGAALVALLHLGLIEEDLLIKSGSILK